MTQFAEMEKVLQQERRDLERKRRELFLERLAWRRRCNNVKDEVSRCYQNGPGTQESVDGIKEALGMLGIGEGMEFREGAGAGAADGTEMQQDGQDGTAVPKIEPIASEEPGFRNHVL